MRALTLLFLIAVATGASSYAAEPPEAAPRLYHVEVVIFRALTPLGVPEDWSLQGAGRTEGEADQAEAAQQDEATGTADAPSEPVATRADAQPLPPEQFKLGNLQAALQRSANYRVLAHTAWTQAATPRGADIATSLAQLGIRDPQLQGSIGLEQGRYLYLNFDLGWTPADPPFSLLGATSRPGPVTFTIQQKRRVRATEQHYIDHPAFGVIAAIWPISP